MHWFDRVAAELATEHRVIRVDLLGHGCTSAATELDAAAQAGPCPVSCNGWEPARHRRRALVRRGRGPGHGPAHRSGRAGRHHRAGTRLQLLATPADHVPPRATGTGHPHPPAHPTLDGPHLQPGRLRPRAPRRRVRRPAAHRSGPSGDGPPHVPHDPGRPAGPTRRAPPRRASPRPGPARARDPRRP
jgi:hypothetical protein